VNRPESGHRQLSLEECRELQSVAGLYADRCELHTSIDKYKKAAEGFRFHGDLDNYLYCKNKLLRLYAETMEFEKLDALHVSLEKHLQTFGAKLNAKSLYTLGVSATYKRNNEEALRFFQESLKLALAEDNKKDICFAISGIAISHSNMGRYQEALREIYNLEVFFQVMPLEEVRTTAKILNAAIFRKIGKFEEAKEILWDCYTSIAASKNFYQYIFLLYSMGLLYLEAGDRRLAAVYIKLAQKSCDPRNLVWLSQKIEEVAERLKSSGELTYDLIYEEGSASVTERRKGRVHFRNQFVLLDLLKLFLNHPGEVFSKEKLVREVWKQEYNPSVHDNKIYVTIKRLRKLIEPDYDKPKYIFRGKNGYYLNKEASVYLDTRSSQGGLSNGQI
jgi:DNA-binding winged helix-turn-helix (wHTH) protein